MASTAQHQQTSCWIWTDMVRFVYSSGIDAVPRRLEHNSVAGIPCVPEALLRPQKVVEKYFSSILLATVSNTTYCSQEVCRDVLRRCDGAKLYGAHAAFVPAKALFSFGVQIDPFNIHNMFLDSPANLMRFIMLCSKNITSHPISKF